MIRPAFALRAAGALLVLAALAAPAAAQPGHGHDHHGHDHGHDHAPARGGDDPRTPLLGEWTVDVDATLDADPKMKQAAAADGALDEARRVFGRTGLYFGPDGRATARLPEGLREGIYVAHPRPEGGLAIRIVDAQDNDLHTADYEARIEDGALHMRQGDTTLIFRRPGARAAGPARPRAEAKPIFGTWTVDVPRTLAADTRLARMTAEQQKAARDGARAFLSQFVFGWQADGTATIEMGGQARRNTWTLVGREGQRFTLSVEGPDGRPETLVLDLDGDFMRMTMGPQVLVLTRAKASK